MITLKEETINKKEEQKDTSTEEISSEVLNQEKEENGEESRKGNIIIKLNQIENNSKEEEKNKEINKIENDKEEEIHFENDIKTISKLRVFEEIENISEIRERNSFESKNLEKNEINLNSNTINEGKDDRENKYVINSSNLVLKNENIKEVILENENNNLFVPKIVKKKEKIK